jgi:hypothetical protein
VAIAFAWILLRWGIWEDGSVCQERSHLSPSCFQSFTGLTIYPPVSMSVAWCKGLFIALWLDWRLENNEIFFYCFLIWVPVVIVNYVQTCVVLPRAGCCCIPCTVIIKLKYSEETQLPLIIHMWRAGGKNEKGYRKRERQVTRWRLMTRVKYQITSDCSEFCCCSTDPPLILNIPLWIIS